MKPWRHFKTITHHRLLVMINCFRIGLIRQGLSHDLSKYSPTEFWLAPDIIKAFAAPMPPSGSKMDTPPPGSITKGATGTTMSTGPI